MNALLGAAAMPQVRIFRAIRMAMMILRLAAEEAFDGSALRGTNRRMMIGRGDTTAARIARVATAPQICRAMELLQKTRFYSLRR